MNEKYINYKPLTYEDCQWDVCLDDIPKEEREEVEKNRLFWRLWKDLKGY